MQRHRVHQGQYPGSVDPEHLDARPDLDLASGTQAVEEMGYGHQHRYQQRLDEAVQTERQGVVAAAAEVEGADSDR